MPDDDFLTRREAQILIDSAAATAFQQMAVEERERKVHEDIHDREHTAHTEKHKAEGEAVRVALAAVDRERVIHAEAHGREHGAHSREHELNDKAISKAEAATDLRFASANQFREQLRDQANRLATSERVDAISKDIDRRFTELGILIQERFAAAEKLTQDRYDTNRASIISLEKGDVKSEGRSLGQGAVVAAIVVGLTVTGTVISLVVVIANLLSAS